MKNKEEKQPLDLWTLASQISTPDEAEVFFSRLMQETKSYDDPAPRALLNTGIENLMESSKFDSAKGGEVIEKYILPLCLEEDALLSPVLLHARAAQEILSNWISQYPDEARFPLRARILQRIASNLAIGPSIAAIDALAAVGLRSPWTERILNRYLKDEGPLGQAAVSCLCALSPSQTQRSRLVNIVRRRYPRSLTSNFSYAIQELASPKFIPMLKARAFCCDEDIWQMSFLLGRICDHAPGDQKVQTRVWRIFEAALNKSSEASRQWLAAGNTIANCNTANVVQTLLKCLTKPDLSLHLIANQLRDCFRPEQLRGWRSGSKAEVKAALAKYATLPGSLTRSRIVEDSERESAWETAFCAGISDVSAWLSATDENSPIAVAEALTYSSFVLLAKWPPFVTRLATETTDVGKGFDPWLSARRAAVEMLAATESVEALEILSRCGFMGGGAPLRSTTELFGDLIERLSTHNLGTILEHLFLICEDRRYGGNRMQAIVGLQRLADAGMIPSEFLDRVLALAFDESLPQYATAAVIWIAASFNLTRSKRDIVERLDHNVKDLETSEDVRFQSLQALVHLDIWAEHKQAILSALGLDPETGMIDSFNLRSYQGWQAYALGLLVSRDPALVLQAAKQLLEDGDGQVAHLFLRSLESGQGAQADVLAELGRSAITRSCRVLALSFGETDNFKVIARLASRDFLRVRWENLWGDWMPQVRSALADSLREIPNPDEDGRGRIFELLEGLLSDSTYAVRRSAARAYSRIDSEQLKGLCQRWMHSGQTDLRIRCAECAEWLMADDPKALDNLIVRTLLEDPEPSVRTAAKRSRIELRRREWRTVALEEVKVGGRDSPQQWVSNSYCYGRALVSLGDDETIIALKELRRIRNTPVCVRNWLKALIEDVTKHWREETQKWPEPLTAWSGQIEELQSEFLVDGHRFKSKLSLWLRRQEDPTDTASWGGAFRVSSLEQRMQFVLAPRFEAARLEIDGREAVRIWFSGSSGESLSFVGTGAYPHPTGPTPTDGDD